MSEVALRRRGEAVILQPVGDLDAFAAPRLREAFAFVPAVGTIAVDLSEVPFIDSAGLGALVAGLRRAREAGATVAVCCPRPTVGRVLRRTGIDRLFPVEDRLPVEVASSAPSPQPA